MCVVQCSVERNRRNARQRKLTEKRSLGYQSLKGCFIKRLSAQEILKAEPSNVFLARSKATTYYGTAPTTTVEKAKKDANKSINLLSRCKIKISFIAVKHPYIVCLTFVTDLTNFLVTKILIEYT